MADLVGTALPIAEVATGRSGAVPGAAAHAVPAPLRRATTAVQVALSAVRGRLWPVPPSSFPGAPPLVSIVIPTLCAGPHAGRLAGLERLLSRDLPAQTHRAYEALVVCDGPNPAVARMIAHLGDRRIGYHATATRSGRWGHPATRMGLQIATGAFFVRMNDDNRPFPDYLASLLSGFAAGSTPDASDASEVPIDVSYARVVFGNEARRFWEPYFRHRWSYVLPSDRKAHLHSDNIDCMNVMVRMAAAKAHRDAWDDAIDADWHFLEAVLREGHGAAFVDRLVGRKN